MNAGTKGMTLAQVCFRRFSQSAMRRSAASDVREVPAANFAKMKARQKALQVEDGTPVHIKLGTMDKLLFGITTLMVTICVGMSGEVLWDLTFRDA